MQKVRTATSLVANIQQHIEEERHNEALRTLNGLVEDNGQVIMESLDISIVDLASAIGTLYARLGQFRDAEKYFRHVWEVRRKLLGENHHSTLMAYVDLFEVLLELEKASILVVAEMYNAAHGSLGGEHPTSSRCAFLLAQCQMQDSDYDVANDLLDKCLQKQQETLGIDDKATLKTMAVHGKCLALQGNLQQAKSILEECIQKQTSLFGAECADVLWSRFELAEVARKIAYDQTEDMYRDVLAMQAKTLGDQHAHTAISQFALASMYFEQGRLEEVEPLLLSSIEVFQRALGPEHERTLTAQKNLTALRYALPTSIAEGSPEAVQKVQYWATVFWVGLILSLLLSYGCGQIKTLWLAP